MSNEELAKRGIQDKNAMAELYQRNRKIIYKVCNKFINKHNTYDDLMQEAYFALIIAVQAYNKSGGYKFITYLVKALKWHFMRYNKQKANGIELPILDNSANSNDEGGTTKANMIPDDAAVEDFEIATDKVALSGLYAEVEKVLNTFQICNNVPVPLNAYIVDAYKSRLTHKQIAEKYNTTHQAVTNAIQRAMRILKNNRNIRLYYDDIIGSSISRGSLNFYKTTGMSSVEWAVMELNK